MKNTADCSGWQLGRGQYSHSLLTLPLLHLLQGCCLPHLCPQTPSKLLFENTVFNFTPVNLHTFGDISC